MRRKGAGRRGYEETIKDVDALFIGVLRDHTAGDPMNEEIIWTDLTKEEIVEKLAMVGVKASKTVVKKLLKKHRYRRRKAKKTKAMGKNKNRNEQFENISILRSFQEATENPIISLDTKKKELIGNFYRDGKLLSKEEIEVYDHDFPSFADGVIIPHGIYDLKRNTGYINIGVSRDTGEFACDCIRKWWYEVGKKLYPNATSILVLCDGGGSNSSRHYLFKEDLIKLVDELGVEIRIAHYPPYTSKYNPIEHRLFPHVTRACQGVIFKSIDLVRKLMMKTSTKTGLSVKVNVIDKIYETKRKVAKGFKETIHENSQIIFHDILPKWNYSVVPKTLQVI